MKAIDRRLGVLQLPLECRELRQALRAVIEEVHEAAPALVVAVHLEGDLFSFDEAHVHPYALRRLGGACARTWLAALLHRVLRALHFIALVAGWHGVLDGAGLHAEHLAQSCVVQVAACAVVEEQRVREIGGCSFSAFGEQRSERRGAFGVHLRNLLR